MIKETVDIIGDLVALMQPKIVVSSVVNNGDGTVTFETLNTSYLSPKITCEILGVDYPILSLQFNKSFTIKSSVDLSSVTEIVLKPLNYKHGTIMATKGEIDRKRLKSEQFPLVYLLEILKDDFDDDENSRIDRTSNLRLFFLSETDENNWDTHEHYEYSIKPMRNVIYDFVKFLDKISIIGEFDSHTITNHAKFGVYISGKGSVSRIFSDNLSGAELGINLPILKQKNCGDNEINVFCKSAKITNSNNLFTAYVPSGGELTLNDNIITDSDGEIIQLPAQTNFTCKQTAFCEPVTIQQSDNTLIAQVQSGGTYNVEDSEISINGNLFDSVKATDDLNIEVRQSTGNTLIGSKQGQYYRIGDSVIELDGEGLELISSVKATDGLILKVTNENLDHISQVYVDQGNIVIQEIYMRNSNNSFSQTIDYINNNELPDVTHTDSDGIGVTLPAMIPMVCTPSVQCTPRYGGEIVKDKLKLYLDSSNIDSYSGSGANLFDLTDNNFDAVLIGSPTYTNGFNGLLEFKNNNNYMSLNTFTVNESKPFTLQIPLFLSSSTSLNLSTIASLTSNLGNRILIGLGTISAYAGVYISGGLFPRNSKTNNILSKDKFHLITIEFDGINFNSFSSFNVSVNNVDNPLVSGNNVGGAYSNTVIGTNGDAGNFEFNGYIPQVIFYEDKILTTLEKANNFNVLNAQYNFGI